MDGKKIKSFLLQKGVNLAELASKMGLSAQALQSRFDSDPKVSFVNEIAENTGFSLYQLLPMCLADGEQISIVHESSPGYTSINTTLKNELAEMFKENVQLHETLVKRGNFIVTLLENQQQTSN